MINTKIIIGANYGDEGKGLAADYFCPPGVLGNPIIGVLTNGTAQRGHTVTLADGRSHVFHHFSSATFQGADTYICKEFVINPVIFVKEYWELLNKHAPHCKTYIHPDCKVATPLDMLANLENRKLDDLHNTCGVGFWKTLHRYELAVESLTIRELANMNYVQREYFFNNIYKYYGYFFNNLTSINFQGLKEHFFEDLDFMLKRIKLVEEHILNDYNTVIFENGQGLLIGEQRLDANWDFCTPSDTGVAIAFNIIENNHLFTDNVEVCYVSRTYLTRHGDGPLDNSCEVKDIGPAIYDFTNITNSNQGRLRYGKLNTKELRERINDDFALTCLSPRKYNLSVMLTHWNEYNCDMTDFDDCHLYLSSTKTREGVDKVR